MITQIEKESNADAGFDDSVTILVKTSVKAGFSGGYKPILSYKPTLVLHLAFRFGIVMQ